MNRKYLNNVVIKGAFGLNTLEGHFAKAISKPDFATRYLSYVSELMQKIDVGVVEKIIDVLVEAGHRGNTVYCFGNGGSAATASHIANDIAIGTRAPGSKPLKAISLADNLAVVTALANDEGYSNVFVRQLDGVLQPGDVIFAFSVSGNSPNVLEALRFAKEQGAVIIGCTGCDGGIIRRIADISLHVPAQHGEYGPIEDVFAILGHLIYSYLRMERRGHL